jgi:hypothetical protein
MFNYKFCNIIVILLFFFLVNTNNLLAYEGLNADHILIKADESRSPWSDFTMTATLTYEKDNEPKKDIFRVFVKDHLKSLVIFISPVKQQGNCLLMVDENLWYFVKDTQRPVRITPIQKLSGGASYGDISRLSWSKDYEAEIAGEEIIKINEKDYDTWHLNLKAHSPSATYNTIHLYVEKATGFPRKAIVFLKSGKKMKTIYFLNFSKHHGKMLNTTIQFVDHLCSDSITNLLFSHISVNNLPERYFLKSNLQNITNESPQ